jgi:hypothetical protein
MYNQEERTKKSFVRFAGPAGAFDRRLRDGYTRDRNLKTVSLAGVSVQRIQLFAVILMAQFPPYHTTKANCHQFAKDLYYAMRAHYSAAPVSATVIEQIEKDCLEARGQASIVPTAAAGADQDRPLDSPQFVDQYLSFSEDDPATNTLRFNQKRDGVVLILQSKPRAVHFYYDTVGAGPDGQPVPLRRYFTVTIDKVSKQPVITFRESLKPDFQEFMVACRLHPISLADIKTVAIVTLSRFDNLDIFGPRHAHQLIDGFYNALGRLFGSEDLTAAQLHQLNIEMQAVAPVPTVIHSIISAPSP